MAPGLGESSAAQGAIQLTCDWDFRAASKTLGLACADPLAETAPHWPPFLDLARGQNDVAATRFETWARLDPGNGGKASVASEFWGLARRFDLAIRWGLRAIELDPQNHRAALLLASYYVMGGKTDDGLRIARRIQHAAPEVCEPNMLLVALLAVAGQRSEARAVLSEWNRLKREGIYEPPLMQAIVYAWLGETSLALEAMHRVVEDRQTVCLFARSAYYLSPLHGELEFERMLADVIGLDLPLTGTS